MHFPDVNEEGAKSYNKAEKLKVPWPSVEFLVKDDMVGIFYKSDP